MPQKAAKAPSTAIENASKKEHLKASVPQQAAGSQASEVPPVPAEAEKPRPAGDRNVGDSAGLPATAAYWRRLRRAEEMINLDLREQLAAESRFEDTAAWLRQHCFSTDLDVLNDALADLRRANVERDDLDPGEFVAAIVVTLGLDPPDPDLVERSSTRKTGPVEAGGSGAIGRYIEKRGRELAEEIQDFLEDASGEEATILTDVLRTRRANLLEGQPLTLLSAFEAVIGDGSFPHYLRVPEELRQEVSEFAAKLSEEGGIEKSKPVAAAPVPAASPSAGDEADEDEERFIRICRDIWRVNVGCFTPFPSLVVELVEYFGMGGATDVQVREMTDVFFADWAGMKAGAPLFRPGGTGEAGAPGQPAPQS